MGHVALLLCDILELLLWVIVTHGDSMNVGYSDSVTVEYCDIVRGLLSIFSYSQNICDFVKLLT